MAKTNLVTMAENASSTSFVSFVESTCITPSTRTFPIADTHASTTVCEKIVDDLYFLCQDDRDMYFVVLFFHLN